MPSTTDNPVDKKEVVVVKIETPAEVNHETVSSAIAFFLNSSATSFLYWTVSVASGWTIIRQYLGLLVYGLASAAEHFISATRLGPSSVYAIAAHSGRIGCLCILVASVASLFYL
ncbi:hypothetical protein L2E82_47687 [Cichorium intybus]|uniref:Uncharacterized protein n=1 Tax=Cichorium intybus TaxID=13427 RepID=A0ACB8YWA0_CICIN|nr:hypothetical protein L2E82_47687 [Cichorium intybus]